MARLSYAETALVIFVAVIVGAVLYKKFLEGKI